MKREIGEGGLATPFDWFSDLFKKVTRVNLEFENDVLNIIPSQVTFVMPSHTQFEDHRSM